MNFHLQKSFGRLTHTTMRVMILTLFLSLTLIAFSTTLGFLYYKNFHALSTLSKKVVELSSGRILEQVDALLNTTQILVEGSSSLVQELTDISANNVRLRSYMLNAARYHPDMPYLFIGGVNGDYVEVGNIRASSQSHFLSNPTKPLPKEVLYEWQYFQKTDGSLKGMTYYYDKDFKEIASEDVSLSNYDPRKRPWYEQAIKAGKFTWSNVYLFFDSGEPGIAAIIPINSPSGSFVGVLGADLPFGFLSDFLGKQRIGKSGRPFVIDKKSGDLLLPGPSVMKSSPINKSIVMAAYEIYSNTNENDFHFKSGGVRYLAHMELLDIHANANWVISIIVPFEDFFGEYDKTQMVAWSIVLLICLISSLVMIYFSGRLSAPIVALSNSIDKIKHLDLASEERVVSNIKEISLMDSSVYSMRLAFRSFVHYVPKEIVKQLLSQNKEIVLGGEKKEVTILFSDISDFTSISEAQPTEILMPLLAEYFDGLSKIILQTNGTIDKYIGDGIMAFWGAPLDMNNHVIACAEATLLCNAFVHRLNQQRQTEGKIPFFTRFGVNTGTVIVGNIGTSERMNYTLIGDIVNSASRLQQVNKIYHTNIIISEQVAKTLGARFLVRPLDTVEVKGKKEKIVIYELMASQDGPEQIRPTPNQTALSEAFTKAYESFYSNNWQLAKELFEEIIRKFPTDTPTQIYLERLKSI